MKARSRLRSDENSRDQAEPELDEAPTREKSEDQVRSLPERGEHQLEYFDESKEAFEQLRAEEQGLDLEDENLLLDSEEDAEDSDFAARQTEETLEGLRKKLKYFSFLPHFVEIGGKNVTLTATAMDLKIYDGPEKYRIAPKLQDCLMGVMKKKGLGHIKVAIVDLTKGNTQPELAAYDHKQPVFAASIPKIAAMLGAFQLRHDLEVSLKQKGAKTLDELFSLVRNRWGRHLTRPRRQGDKLAQAVSLRGKLVLGNGAKIALGEPKSPRLENIFAAVPTGKPVTIEFMSTGEDKAGLKKVIDEFNKGVAGAKQKLRDLGFVERLRVMIGGMVPASNYATSTIVGDVGFLYIASTLLQSGLYDTNRNGGLWLGADYWTTTWRGALRGGGAQSATAGSLAAFMTLLAQKCLVSPKASTEMQGLMRERAQCNASRHCELVQGGPEEASRCGFPEDRAVQAWCS